jgi:hypothetical protein
MSAVLVVAGVAYLDTLQLCEVNLEMNVLPEDPLGARAYFLSSSFVWVQSRYDAG